MRPQLFLLAALAFGPQGCDCRSMLHLTPAQIRLSAQDGLRQYFPKAQVIIDTQHKSLVGVTCTTNLSELTVNKIGELLEQDPSMQQLKTFHSIAGLNTFGLAFDKYVIALDLNSGRSYVAPISAIRGYSRDYQQACQAGDSQGTYVFIGDFVVTVEDSTGTRKQLFTSDALGVYKNEEFEAARSEELTAREAILRHFFDRKGYRVIEVRLRGIRPLAYSAPP